MNHLRLLTTATVALLLATDLHAEPLLVDSFESGDMSATNDAGFRWESNNRTSVVTSEAAVYNNKEIYVVPSRSVEWDPLHGDHSLRFRYPAGEPMAEQRFDLGTAYEDIWIRYWVRVPVNFSHGENSANNKFFAIWMDGYSAKGSGSTVFWNFWGEPDRGSSLKVAWNEGNYSSTGGQIQPAPFISVPEDRGRWMQVVINVKASSSANASDGYIGFWRRWEGERQFTQLHEVKDVNLPTPTEGPDGWKNGYLMGWANAAYEEDTEWFVDQFEVSNEPLLATVAQNAPNPPTLIRVE